MFAFILSVTVCTTYHVVKIIYLIVSITRDDRKSTSSK